MAPLIVTRFLLSSKQCLTQRIAAIALTRSHTCSAAVNYFPPPKVKSSDHYTGYHEVPSENWKFVERLMPPKLVPEYPKQESYPSGWTPPSEAVPNLPYFVRRTKNAMIPVYLHLEAIRQVRKITIIRHVEGDIWALKEELQAHLQKVKSRPVVSQVNEVGMYIKFKGDHVLAVKDWLTEKGF